MDPSQLAAQAVGILPPYLTEAGKVAAKQAGEAAERHVEALLVAIRRRFGSDQDSYGQQRLERLEQQPGAEGRRQTLADVLSEEAAADPAFTAELQRLIQRARDEPATSQFLTQVYDRGRVDQLFKIGSIENLNVGRREST